MVHRSRLAVDATPLVRELASVEDEFGRLLTVVLDRTERPILRGHRLRHAWSCPGLRADSTRGKRFRGDQSGPPGWGEHTYHNRIRTEKQRHFEAIARELFTIDRRQPAHGIVLAGTGTDAGAVEPFLHNYLVERVIGTARLNPKEATPAAVHEATLAVREAWERDDGAGPGARDAGGAGERLGVNGMTPTLRALSRGQVRALLVHADASEPGLPLLGTRAGWPSPSATAAAKASRFPCSTWWTTRSKRRCGRAWTSTWSTSPRRATRSTGSAGLLRFR